MNLIRCENCGVELDENIHWYRLEVEGEIIYRGEKSEMHFCTHKCIIHYLVRHAIPSLYVCIKDHADDLVAGRVYLRIREPGDRLESGDLRIIDESREDYIHPASYFAPLSFSSRAMTEGA